RRHPPGPVRRASPRVRRRRRDAAARPAPLDGAQASVRPEARRERRRASALDVAECGMRRALLTLVALTALAAPAAAGAARDVTIRSVGLGEFPRVQLTAVVPQGSRPVL